MSFRQFPPQRRIRHVEGRSESPVALALTLSLCQEVLFMTDAPHHCGPEIRTFSHQSWLLSSFATEPGWKQRMAPGLDGSSARLSPNRAGKGDLRYTQLRRVGPGRGRISRTATHAKPTFTPEKNRHSTRALSQITEPSWKRAMPHIPI